MIPQPEHVVSLQQYTSTTLAQGSHSTMTLSFQIEEGYQLMRNQRSDDVYPFTQLVLPTSDLIAFGKPGFPESAAMDLPGTDYEIGAYSGEIDVEVPVRIADYTPIKKHRIEGYLEYHAFDAMKCLSPQKLEFHLIVEVRSADGM